MTVNQHIVTATGQRIPDPVGCIVPVAVSQVIIKTERNTFCHVDIKIGTVVDKLYIKEAAKVMFDSRQITGKRHKGNNVVQRASRHQVMAGLKGQSQDVARHTCHRTVGETDSIKI